MRRGAEWLAARLKASASRPVVYSRGERSVTVQATAGPKPLRVSGDPGTRVRWDNGDYTIAAADIDFGDGPEVPLKGDTVSETLGGVAYVFRVSALPGEECWRWADGYGILRRIHTKQVSEG